MTMSPISLRWSHSTAKCSMSLWICSGMVVRWGMGWFMRDLLMVAV